MIMHFAVNSFSTFGGDYALGWIPVNFLSVTLLIVIPAALAVGLISWRTAAAKKRQGAQSERFRISVFGVCAHTVRDKNRFLLVQEPVFWWGKANPIDFFTRSCYNKVIIFCKRGMGKCQ